MRMLMPLMVLAALAGSAPIAAVRAAEPARPGLAAFAAAPADYAGYRGHPHRIRVRPYRRVRLTAFPSYGCYARAPWYCRESYGPEIPLDLVAEAASVLPDHRDVLAPVVRRSRHARHGRRVAVIRAKG